MATKTSLKIIQHNVLFWKTRKNMLCNIYLDIDPDIILINSHGLLSNEPLKIPGYKIHKKNTTNTIHDGNAIAIKHNINHKIQDNFISDLLVIDVETTTGKITIATTYQPPSRSFILTPDFLQLFQRNNPVYLAADLNAQHPNFGYNHSNTPGRQLTRMINNRIIQHIGPFFPTYYTRNRGTNPDIMLTNYKTHHNTHITQGPLTPSDHLPIILTISSAPIIIPATARPNFKSAQWNDFQDHVDTHLNKTSLNYVTTTKIDEEIEHWQNTVMEAKNRHIPTTTHRTLPHPKHSTNTKMLLIQFTALKQHAWMDKSTLHTLQNHSKTTNRQPY